MSDKLKPCPFCGHTPMIDDHKIMDGIMYRVKCACGVSTGYYRNEKYAIMRWHTRIK